jgi:hypothetical protein
LMTTMRNHRLSAKTPARGYVETKKPPGKPGGFSQARVG